MILFVQPFGLNSPGGGPRILRALLEEAPRPFLSICTLPNAPPPTRLGNEVHLPFRPQFGRMESTRFARWLSTPFPLYQRVFAQKLERVLRSSGAAAVHCIPQGLDFWPAFQVARRLGIPYHLNVHDDLDYALQGYPERGAALAALAHVWAEADSRIVIGEAMGEEYSRRYGRRDYTIITDGLEQLPPVPLPRPDGTLRIYFSGAVHLSYEPNFRCLVAALNLLQRQRPDLRVSVTCRGSDLPSGGAVPVRSLPWASEAEVARDLEEADLLYLPLPFEKRYEKFYRFSVSTKMVTYLGSGLPVVYHGPADAAAARLLEENEAAIMAATLDPGGLAELLSVCRKETSRTVRNALALGRSRFWLPELRERFWSLVGS